MILSQLLQPKNNSLGSFRILAALLVIYGHAPAFLSEQAGSDFVFDWLGFDYSGSLAVKFFFMLSGLLVTHSLLARPQILPFLLRRAIRIFPGLFVCIFLSVFVLGLVLTDLSIGEYLLHPQTWRYWLHNSSLIGLQWGLPGVFTAAKISTVNGSLWTLPLEILCYLSLAIFFLAIIRRHRCFASLLLFFPISLVAFGTYYLPQCVLKYNESLVLGGCFCLGIFFGLNQERIRCQWQGVVLLVILTTLFWDSIAKPLIFYITFFYVCLWFSSVRFFTGYLRLSNDPSYGIYIYGFVIQQTLALFFPHTNIVAYNIAAMLAALIVGYVSWRYVEKPAIEWAKRFTERVG